IELLQLATDKYTKAREEIAGKKDGNDIMSAIAGQFDGALNSLVNFANTGQASISQRRRGPAAGVPPAAAGQVARRARQQHRRRRWWGTHLAGHAHRWSPRERRTRRSRQGIPGRGEGARAVR